MLTLTSPAFRDGEPIPKLHLGPGHGRDVSPALYWSGAPAGTKAFALTLTDEDAPGYQHWLVVLPGVVDQTPEGTLPPGSVAGMGTRAQGYEGPCPPSGLHHYVFTIAALDVFPKLRKGFDVDELTDAISGHVLASATLGGTYQPKLGLRRLARKFRG